MVGGGGGASGSFNSLKSSYDTAEVQASATSHGPESADELGTRRVVRPDSVVKVANTITELIVENSSGEGEPNA
jgi:hypothetical protein